VAFGAGASSRHWHEKLSSNPDDTSLQVKLAVSLFEEEQVERASKMLQAILRERPKDAQARFLQARLEESRDPKACAHTVQGLLDEGYRGYDSYMLHARCQHASGEDASASLRAASQQDPTQSQPLIGLWKAAEAQANDTQQVESLRELVKLEQHAGPVYRRLLQLLLKRGEIAEAVTVGQSAIWVDVEDAETHLLYAEALRGAHQLTAAQFELDSALACTEDPTLLARAHALHAELASQLGQGVSARRHRTRAAELQGQH
jgi:tetratricopeptide (TPR) repeat protein